MPFFGTIRLESGLRNDAWSAFERRCRLQGRASGRPSTAQSNNRRHTSRMTWRAPRHAPDTAEERGHCEAQLLQNAQDADGPPRLQNLPDFEQTDEAQDRGLVIMRDASSAKSTTAKITRAQSRACATSPPQRQKSEADGLRGASSTRKHKTQSTRPRRCRGRHRALPRMAACVAEPIA